MMRIAMRSLIVISVVPGLLHAQRYRMVDVVPFASTQDALARLGQSDALGVIFQASRDGRATYLMNRRTRPSEVELHRTADDLFIVQSGQGVIRVGGIVTGDWGMAPGERRGGRQRDAADVVVRAGDLVRVPAGVPHSVLPASSTLPLVYLVVKLRRDSPGGR